MFQSKFLNSSAVEYNIGDLASIHVNRHDNLIQVTTAVDVPQTLLDEIAMCIGSLKDSDIVDETGITILRFTQQPATIPKMCPGWICSTNCAVYGWIPTRILMYAVDDEKDDINDVFLKEPDQQVTRFTSPYTTVFDYLGFLNFQGHPLKSTMICCGLDDFYTHNEGHICISDLKHVFNDEGELLIYSFTMKTTNIFIIK